MSSIPLSAAAVAHFTPVLPKRDMKKSFQQELQASVSEIGTLPEGFHFAFDLAGATKARDHAAGLVSNTKDQMQGFFEMFLGEDAPRVCRLESSPISQITLLGDDKSKASIAPGAVYFCYAYHKSGKSVPEQQVILKRLEGNPHTVT